jgi:glycerophosphoryl diester phosphodiesterase
MPKYWSAPLSALLLVFLHSAPASADTPGVRRLLRPHDDRIMIVAHRACHNAAPAHGRGAAPENSLAALENCVAIGIDMIEIDVRRSADGELVVIHDPTVDRTTTGKGRVADMPLAALRALPLRQNLGGPGAAATDERIATLDEMLAAARGRILLNLDVKEAIYAETIDAVLRAKMRDQVIVKAVAGPRTPPLAAMRLYREVPFAPILQGGFGSQALVGTARHQMEDAEPVAFELPSASPQQVAALAEATRDRGVPLWVNTLWDGFVTGWGGDAAALRDPDAVWGRLYRAGVRIFQTDEPAALLAFRARLAEQRPERERRP